MAGQSCLICAAPIRPGEAVSFQDGELVHMACYNGQSQATRRRKETTYKGHTIRLYCYPVMGQWRPIAIIEFPGGVNSRRLGRMKLCDSTQQALTLALKTATDSIDKGNANAAERCPRKP